MMNDKIAVDRDTFKGYTIDAKLMTVFDYIILLNDKIERKSGPMHASLTFIGAFLGGMVAVIGCVKGLGLGG